MRKVLTFAGVIALISLLATCITTDTTNPVVSIISPVNNDTITAGNILIKVYATDNKEVTKVEFYIDNNLKGTDQAGNADTFRYTWDASAETPGSTHSIYAKAYDGAGNTATSTSITIVIAGGGGGTGPTHHSGTITQNETWYPSGNPHIIDSDISVENNATLTIKPGCIVKFEPGTELYAGYHGAGAIIANGTQDSTILFTSNVATPAPGDWQNVGLYDLAMSTSSFRYCIFEYGGSSSSWPGEFYAEGITSVKIANCTFRYSGNYGVYLDDDAGFNTFTNNSITACAQFPLRIHAEYARTVGSGNSLSGNTQNGILIKGGNVQTSGTWINHNVPYVIEGDVDVGSNTSNPVLTIAPGTTIQLQPDVEFYCGYHERGAIKADGTGERIRFISSSSSPSRGDWQSLGFYQYTIDAEAKLINCTIEYGGGDGYGNIVIENALPEIRGDSIGHSAAYGIYLDGSEYPIPNELRANNTFYDCVNGDIREP